MSMYNRRLNLLFELSLVVSGSDVRTEVAVIENGHLKHTISKNLHLLLKLSLGGSEV